MDDSCWVTYFSNWTIAKGARKRCLIGCCNRFADRHGEGIVLEQWSKREEAPSEDDGKKHTNKALL